MILIHTLSNGIRVVYERADHMHTVSFGVWIETGSVDETRENNGIAHVIEHMLFRGTRIKTARDIARITALLGGNLNAYTCKEYTSYNLETLPECLGEAAALLSDMLQNAAMESALLDKEKSIILEEIDMYEDSAEDMVDENLEKLIFRDHALGFLVSGEKETVAGFTSDQVMQFYREHYTAEHMIISVAGQFEETQMLEQMEQYFAGIPAVCGGGRNQQRVSPVYHKSRWIKEKDMEQVHLNIAFPGVSECEQDKYAFYLLDAVLGGSVTSRLFQRIREDMGLAYAVESYGSLYRDTGLLRIQAAMNQSQQERVFDEIIRVLSDLRKDGIQEKELQDAKKEIQMDMRLQLDNMGYRMECNAENLLYHKKTRTVEERLQSIGQVSTDDVKRVIDRCICLEQISIAQAGSRLVEIGSKL